ncbi:putative NADH-quinone reductase, membrane protein [Candidatus Competibacter denitrificans Run_A_D11]|uniref:Ion-translocating oxidoreductase complex subunit E n=1 Tax=Candidatus Competibacter denitrificans Run_A_D11 TaxID=1400863 RepID=W6MBJ5_9GAMM|nr:electron transport complex subunit E [Candidatus Competibacter denitrificans]CDI01343.1 putative NADH-quinone reductase, membrane protein [Candidatus Competibacter denitrificans Run_A_D11]HAS86530.1 electron transport complex subunit RsxE [Candidatus Competibacteraceae bacterium]HRC68198.1 electron transport complex subunit E [Candidatus Competibacter denitrificans]
MSQSYREILKNGVWTQNTGFVALLGLCPLLATSNSVVNGLGLGLATTLVLLLSNVAISLIRNLVRPEVRIPVFVMVIACVVTAVELAMHAFLPGLYTVLGIFIPLIVTNCCVIGRAEAFAFKNGVAKSAVDGMATGLGFTLALVLLGALREILGQGTLFGQAELLFGEAGRGLTLHVLDDYRGFLLAILPPGAFIGLGCLIAIKNVLDAHAKRRAAAKPAVALQEVQA